MASVSRVDLELAILQELKTFVMQTLSDDALEVMRSSTDAHTDKGALVSAVWHGHASRARLRGVYVPSSSTHLPFFFWFTHGIGGSYGVGTCGTQVIDLTRHLLMFSLFSLAEVAALVPLLLACVNAVSETSSAVALQAVGMIVELFGLLADLRLDLRVCIARAPEARAGQWQEAGR